MSDFKQQSFKVYIDDKEVTVVMKLGNPFKLQSAVTRSMVYSPMLGTDKVEISLDFGQFAEDVIPLVVVQPKPENLIEMINSAWNGYTAIQVISTNVQQFVRDPKAYFLKSRSEAQKKSQCDTGDTGTE